MYMCLIIREPYIKFTGKQIREMRYMQCTQGWEVQNSWSREEKGYASPSGSTFGAAKVIYICYDFHNSCLLKLIHKKENMRVSAFISWSKYGNR